VQTYEGSRRIDVTVSESGDRIESCCEFDVESATIALIQKEHERLSRLTQPDRSRDEAKLDAKIDSLFQPLRDANRFLLRMIQQELTLIDPIRRLQSGASRWSLDGRNWSTLPTFIFLNGAYGHVLHKLDTEWATRIQKAIDAGEHPLIGVEFWHEAWRQKEDRSRWILATTAAELAIKEALSMLNPSLMTLLLEVPSPPLHKLYGRILDDAAGANSRSAIDKKIRKGLQDGVKIRNKIVHRPESINLDLDDVIGYLQTVGGAIKSLPELIRSRDDSSGS